MDQLQQDSTPQNKKEKGSGRSAIKLLTALLLSLAIFAAAISGAYILGDSIYGGLTDNDRVIVVNGRADTVVNAVSAAIHIDITCTGETVDAAKTKLANVRYEVYSYIKKEVLMDNVNENNLSESAVELFDQKIDHETTYTDSGKEIVTKIDRYSAAKSITLLAVNVKDAANIKTKIEFDFISNGHSTYTTVGLGYGYPDVNDIKPELLKQSLDNARMAAEQFAMDSGQKIGSIQTARQGVVELTECGDCETASIVSTVTFYLK